MDRRSAVCCVIIFQSKQEAVPIDWRTGIDYTVEPVKDADGNIIFEANLGEGKFYPGGPTCNYLGKEVPCLVYVSESGGINADILVDILSEFDKMALFPRTEGGPIPFLLIDGQFSRFDIKFIYYINDQGHPWKVCFGVPYGTSLWQVADSSEQNGCFKMLFYKAKKEILADKYDRDLQRAIRATDVMPILR